MCHTRCLMIFIWLNPVKQLCANMIKVSLLFCLPLPNPKVTGGFLLWRFKKTYLKKTHLNLLSGLIVLNHHLSSTWTPENIHRQTNPFYNNVNMVPSSSPACPHFPSPLVQTSAEQRLRTPLRDQRLASSASRKFGSPRLLSFPS